MENKRLGHLPVSAATWKSARQSSRSLTGKSLQGEPDFRQQLGASSSSAAMRERLGHQIDILFLIERKLLIKEN
jgi:hypothetical protein